MPEEVEKEEVKEDLINKGVEGEAPAELNIAEEVESEEPEEVAEEEEVEVEEPFKTFKTQEEYDSFIGEELQKAQEDVEPAKPSEKPAEAEEPLKFFEEDWKPADWNDYTVSLLKNTEVRKYLSQNMAGDIKTEIDNLTTAERKELETIDEGFDKEYDVLAAAGKVPDRSTEEGQSINKQISILGATYGQTSITKAYDLWSKIPTAQGGGIGYVAPVKAKVKAQKAKSGMIGGSRSGTKATTKADGKYEDIHGKSLDELVQEQLDE